MLERRNALLAEHLLLRQHHNRRLGDTSSPTGAGDSSSSSITSKTTTSLPPNEHSLTAAVHSFSSSSITPTATSMIKAAANSNDSTISFSIQKSPIANEHSLQEASSPIEEEVLVVDEEEQSLSDALSPISPAAIVIDVTAAANTPLSISDVNGVFSPLMSQLERHHLQTSAQSPLASHTQSSTPPTTLGVTTAMATRLLELQLLHAAGLLPASPLLYPYTFSSLGISTNNGCRNGSAGADSGYKSANIAAVSALMSAAALMSPTLC